MPHGAETPCRDGPNDRYLECWQRGHQSKPARVANRRSQRTGRFDAGTTATALPAPQPALRRHAIGSSNSRYRLANAARSEIALVGGIREISNPFLATTKFVHIISKHPPRPEHPGQNVQNISHSRWPSPGNPSPRRRTISPGYGRESHIGGPHLPSTTCD